MATMESKIRYLQEKLVNSGDSGKRLKILQRLDSLPITIELLQATGVGKAVNGLRKQEGELGDQARGLVQKWKGMVPADGIIIPTKQPEKPKAPVQDVSEEPPIKRPKVDSSSHKKDKQAHNKKEKHREPKVNNVNNGGQRSSLGQGERSSTDQGHQQRLVNHQGHQQRSSEHKMVKHDPSNARQHEVNKVKRLKEEDDIETYVKEYQHDKKEHSPKKSSSHKQSRENPSINSVSVKQSAAAPSKKVSSSNSKSSQREKVEKLPTSHVKHESKGHPQVTGERPRVNKPSMKETSQPKEVIKETKTDRKPTVSFAEPKEDSFGSGDEDFEEPTQSFEDFLNYDLPVMKVKKKKVKKPFVANPVKPVNHVGTKDQKSSEKKMHKSHHQTTSGAEHSKHKKDKHHSKHKGSKGEGSHSGHGSEGSHKTKSHKHDKEKRKRSSDDPEVKTSSKKQRISDPALTVPDNPVSLPEIQPNYRPLRLPVPDLDMSPHKKKGHGLEDAEFAAFQKNTRTQVYSGRKSHYLREVPSLFDSCMQILCDNIDALEELGGVPYDIIKPVLDKCTPEQLCYLEEQNPYLMEDTDHLWQMHCNRDFRNAQRDQDSFEAWRELYLRKHEEREERLKSITAKVSAAWAGKPQGRTTKLAYLDGPVKPPRDVRRKQEKLGTAGPHAQHKPVSSLSRPRKVPIVKKIRPAGSSSSHGSSSSYSSGGDVLNSGTSSTASSSSGGGRQAKAAKPAPMMQKAMKLMKGKYLAPFRCPFRR
ncbi:elongin-A-like isoform X1 [Branchiostoma floridae]|uniref:Elongin-A-like isoform X1 n=1 Tax=Branchiostoma floridae TaxID=7739 RepID=A0A9J7KE98_BRAFL|nr:elongin-A-like isoform X1 [Branchiostoma floridae]XP_035658774.1 elongin-A-like isoform X1 [Branchiostoma floridae]